MEINKINKDSTKKEKKQDEKENTSQLSSSPKSKKGSVDAESEQKSEKSTDHTYPCTMTKREKVAKFKTFGRVSDDDDGKIIKDENEEVIEVDTDTLGKATSYYGEWWKFAVLFLVICACKGIRVNYDYVMAEWANAAPEV